MDFNLLDIRIPGDGTDRDLYPTMSNVDDPYLIDMDSADGGNIQHFVAKGIILKQDLRESNAKMSKLFEVADTHVDIYITDARLAVVCSKYDKGGGWVGFGLGGLVEAGIANAVSHMRAAHRRKGKYLVGNVRYAWLRAVGGTEQSGWRGQNQLRLVAAADHSRDLYLDLVFAKSAAPMQLAQMVAQRCANFRLARDVDPSSQHRAGFEDLARSPLLASNTKTFTFYYPPHVWYVSAESANLPRREAT